MKNFRKSISVIFAIALLCSSCAKVVYTHDDVMRRYTTKSSVISRFGLASEKRSEGNIEEWYYNYGSNTVLRGYSAPAFNNARIGVGNVQTYTQYVKFTFKGDNVVRYETQGIDYGKKEMNALKVTLWLVGGLGFGVLLGLAGS